MDSWSGITSPLTRIWCERCDAWKFLTKGMRSATSVVKSLRASVQGDPVFMRRVNGWLTIFWILIIPLSILSGWISSVTRSPLSRSGPWSRATGSAWQAARVEVEQAKEVERREEEKQDLPAEIVQRIIEGTDLQRTRIAAGTAR
jgi:hypothetical protein